MPKKIISLSVVLLLITTFFIRVYNLDKLLGFYYDQGRDALVIWDLWHKGKLFLVGPTTGLAGVLRGPYYYYLIAPLYLLGNGNPVVPAIFLVFTTVIAIAIIYWLGKEFYNTTAGIIAVILAGFSFQLVMAARWLSNPTPMLLLSMILVWGMYKVTQGKKWGWPVIAAVSGLSLFNFGSSGELFYVSAIAIFAIWQSLPAGKAGRNWPDLRNLIISILLFVLTFAPLVVFDLKHDGILQKGISNQFIAEKSFTMPTKFLLEQRTKFYYEVFTTKLFPIRSILEIRLLIVLGVLFLWFLPGYFKNPKIKILLLLMISPIIGLYFYQGNDTVLYDYYMTGYYLIFILLVALVLGSAWKYKLGKLFVVYFLFIFLTNNFEFLKLKLTDNSDGPNSISLVNEKEAVDWVYRDSASFAGKDSKFNVDVYVPPVISYSYDYLFLWQGTTDYKKNPDTDRVNLLYTLYEQDDPHPERLNNWLARQKGIGKIEKTEKFGAITVERRTRL